MKNSLLQKTVLIALLCTTFVHASSQTLPADQDERTTFIQSYIAHKIEHYTSFLTLFSDLKTLSHDLSKEEKQSIFSELFRKWTTYHLKWHFRNEFDTAKKVLVSLPKIERFIYLEVIIQELVKAHDTEERYASERFFMACLDLFSDEQILTFMKKTINTKRSPFTYDPIWLQNKKESILKLSETIRKKGSPELQDSFVMQAETYLPKTEVEKWILKLKKEKYRPFNQHKANGPLFSDYAERYQTPALFRLTASYNSPNFEALFPDIATYVAREYDEKRIVLFHGRSSRWIKLEALFRVLHDFKHKTTTPPSFRYLRFAEHSSLTPQQAQDLQNRGADLFGYDLFGCTHPTPQTEFLKEWVLFTNLVPDACTLSDNSLNYAMRNFDLTSLQIRTTFNFDSIIKRIFDTLGLLKEFEYLQCTSPTVFEDLEKLFTEAIEEQGDHGELLVISFPKAIAHQYTYSTRASGEKHYVLINDIHTADTVTIAENYAQAPFRNQFALVLAEDIINPEAAERAGVKIVGFDPAFYWQTEKSLKVRKKLAELIELIKEMHNKEGAITRESPF